MIFIQLLLNRILFFSTSLLLLSHLTKYFTGKEADDEDEGEEDEDSDTDTESEAKVINNELSEELMELTSEISLKQKLIEELEMSQV